MRALGAAVGAAASAVSSAAGASRVLPEDGKVNQVVVVGSAVAGSAAKEGARVAGLAANTAVSAAGSAATLARETALEQSQKAANFARHLRELLEAWLKQKMMAATERVVDKVPGFAKRATDDPDMPRWVARGKDRVIDEAWPEVRSEILWELAVLIDRDASKDEPASRGVDCVRAFFRYHLDPYDKTFWGKMRDPWHVLFLLIPCVPVWGVTPGWFFLVFLMIDKSEEYQLIKFILSFKGCAFISMGIIRAMTGFVMYISCVTAPARPNEHTCESTGPGSGGEILPTFVGFVLQVILVWIAFACLRCSTEKGRSQLKANVTVKEEGHWKPGGLIIYFLWYDLFAFLISMGIVGFAISTRPKFDIEDWPVHHTIYAAQVLYGLLSMPFFLFTLPVLQRLLTHSLPTAYDRSGRCRRPRVPPRGEGEEAKPKPTPVFTEVEMEELLTKVKNLMPNFATPGAGAASP